MIRYFANNIIQWQAQFGRNNLPWQVLDPYKIWVSEIMLQQTQVKTVLDYYPRFIKKFPELQSLANADESEVLQLWAGLGYYSRARNLHHAAKQLTELSPDFPKSRIEWQQLKGIGRSTAAAIVVFAYQQKEAILDGNVKRILTRLFEINGNPNDKLIEAQLWQQAETLLPATNISRYTQGLMDLGAMICTRQNPKCKLCPTANVCKAKKHRTIDQYPNKKTNPIIQTLDYYWPLIINQKNELFLVERKAAGIWAKLLTPPSLTSDDLLSQWYQQQYLDYSQAIALEPIKHRLTHRQLNIHCYISKVTEFNAIEGQFYPLATVLQERIPKPLSNLIINYYEYLGSV